MHYIFDIGYNAILKAHVTDVHRRKCGVLETWFYLPEVEVDVKSDVLFVSRRWTITGPDIMTE